MNIVDQIKSVLLSPKAFFTNLKSEQGIKAAFSYYALLLAFSTIITYFVTPQVDTAALEQLGLGFLATSNGSIIGLVGSYAFTLLLSFVFIGIFHLWLKLFGASVPYSKTYQLVVYAATPQLLLGWIPFIGGLMFIYMIVLEIIGLQITHGLSQLRAILAVLLPLLIIFLLVFVVAIGALAFFGILSPSTFTP